MPGRRRHPVKIVADGCDKEQSGVTYSAKHDRFYTLRGGAWQGLGPGGTLTPDAEALHAIT